MLTFIVKSEKQINILNWKNQDEIQDNKIDYGFLFDKQKNITCSSLINDYLKYEKDFYFKIISQYR